MTEKEIEKALEICGKSGDCLNCPYDVDNCMQKELDALAYINRLKAEKEQGRKETAKEILGDLVDLVIKRNLTIDDIASMAKVYGIEVDE